jgi:acyl dehydratase
MAGLQARHERTGHSGADKSFPCLYEGATTRSSERLGVQDTSPREQIADKLHHEDLAVGKPYVFGRKVVTKDEIVAFGRAFDPQAMHTDEEAAKASPVGGLCASGWHTCAMMMRMLADGLLGQMASLGSPGVDEVRWKRPVRPGDVLSARYTIQERRVLASRPDVGIAKVLVEAVDANGDVPATWLTNQLTRVRHPEPAPAARPAPGGREKAPSLDLWDAPAAGSNAETRFEDRVIGETTDLGSHTFGREEIMAFAREYDPQPFHLDEAAAAASLFGGLCASGWHTAALFIRGIIATRDKANAEARARGVRLATYGPSPGFRDLKWPKPVYVGDTVSYRMRLVEKTDLKSRPSRGLLASAVQGRNQKGELVFAVTSLILADRRADWGQTLRV